VIVSVLAISGLEHLGHQAQEPVILDVLAEDRQEDGVADVVEAPLDITLDEPLGPCTVMGDVAKGGVASTLGSEAMAMRGKLRLVIRFQQEAHYFLQQLV
jgi:hypothetical protein